MWWNTSIQKIKRWTLREHIGVIMQDTTLFNTSIYNNLLRCLPKSWDQVWDEERDAHLKHVLGLAQADFVFDLPHGRDTIIGERWLKLSWWEKQRIALARMLLKDPQMILLDEATSALDTTTEFHIKQVIDRIFTDKTMLIIAHRLSTIQQADWVVVLQEWKILEQGTYRWLLEEKWALWKLVHPEDVSM